MDSLTCKLGTCATNRRTPSTKPNEPAIERGTILEKEARHGESRAPLGSFRSRSPARACRPTHADRCARLHQTILLPADHFVAFAVPEAVV